MTYPSVHDIYREAVTAERAAWDAVRDKLPGSPQFDEDKWRSWRGAMSAVVRALDQLRDSGAPRRPGAVDGGAAQGAFADRASLRRPWFTSTSSAITETG